SPGLRAIRLRRLSAAFPPLTIAPPQLTRSEMPRTAREIRLKSRPVGMPAPENFELAEVPIPEPGPGQMLIRTIWMSVDPYMRGRMSDRKSYAPPFEVGKAMDGRFVGEVMESNGGRFPKGTFVAGMGGGWKEYHVADGKGLFQANPDIPLQAHIGTSGMPGMTAFRSEEHKSELQSLENLVCWLLLE